MNCLPVQKPLECTLSAAPAYDLRSAVISAIQRGEIRLLRISSVALDGISGGVVRDPRNRAVLDLGDERSDRRRSQPADHLSKSKRGAPTLCRCNQLRRRDGNDRASRAGAMDAACAARRGGAYYCHGDPVRYDNHQGEQARRARAQRSDGPLRSGAGGNQEGDRLRPAYRRGSEERSGQEEVVCRSFRRRRMTSSSIAPSTMRSRRRSAH